MSNRVSNPESSFGQPGQRGLRFLAAEIAAVAETVGIGEQV